jgi:hypothetical protein
MVEHLADEEGVPAGDAVQPDRVDGAIANEVGDRVQAQRGHWQRGAVRGAGDVTEQGAHGVRRADLIVAHRSDYQ